MTIKRITDIALSAFGLIILAPLFIVIAVIIKIDSNGPVFFRQERVGKGGNKFRIYKFRSMATAQAKDSAKITVGGDKRITKIGAVLRKYKIDELPQLVNVVLGEMSLVGPRPEVEEYVKYYGDNNKAIVLSVRPGITDLASVKFRNESELLAKETNPQEAYINKILPKKLRYCRFYVKQQSLWLDMRIVWWTLRAVFL